MNTRPRLTRSIPFWLLVGGSVASAGAGAVVLVDKLGVMTASLTTGTATGVEVYVGQIWGVLGAILVGAGVIGLLLALGLASLRAYVPAVAEPAPADMDASTETIADDATSTDDPVDRQPLEPVAR